MKSDEFRDVLKRTLEYYSFGKKINKRKYDSYTSLGLDINIVNWYVRKYYPDSVHVPLSVTNPLFDMLGVLPCKCMAKLDMRGNIPKGVVTDYNAEYPSILVNIKPVLKDEIITWPFTLKYPDIVTLMMTGGGDMFEKFLSENKDKINQLLNIK